MTRSVSKSCSSPLKNKTFRKKSTRLLSSGKGTVKRPRLSGSREQREKLSDCSVRTTSSLAPKSLSSWSKLQSILKWLEHIHTDIITIRERLPLTDTLPSSEQTTQSVGGLAKRIGGAICRVHHPFPVSAMSNTNLFRCTCPPSETTAASSKPTSSNPSSKTPAFTTVLMHAKTYAGRATTPGRSLTQTESLTEADCRSRLGY